jgi:Peptidase family M28
MTDTVALEQAVPHYLKTVAIDEVMLQLARVSAHDRYQASRGIEQAAELVANAADAIGLEEVVLERFPADGASRWWSFRAPASWTPLVARLEIRGGRDQAFEVNHETQPFSVATYSASTPPDGICARLAIIRGCVRDCDLAGAVCVVNRSVFARQELLADIAAAGAVGLVTDARCCAGASDREHPGRIELEPNSPLFGFSVTSSELQRLEAWASAGAQARALIVLDHSARMPVVTAALPGLEQEELWLTAHLCHPRPGANDNASGVASLLGVAAAHMSSRRAHAAWGTQRTLRFLWGPEFVGTAAILHRHTTRAGARLPSAAINLDMVGEDQAICGGPFLVERNPDCQPGLIGPIAEHVVRAVFAHTRTQRGRWRRVPFMGFSDHALFADPRVGCPAVQLCHAPDRFNHSAGDSLDKVSATEMLRATAAGAALAQVAASDRETAQPLLARILRDWSAREQAAAQRVACRNSATEDGKWGAGLVEHVNGQCASMYRLLDGSAPVRLDPRERSAGARLVAGHWSGPFNARAMMADLLLNFAIRADGSRTAAEIVRESSYALARPIAPDTARPLLDALTESGWASAMPASDARASAS